METKIQTFYRQTCVYVIILLIFLSQQCCQSAKILAIFPLPLKSHFAFNNAVMSSLHKAGHEITMMTPFPKAAALENYSKIIDTSEDETFKYVGETAYNAFSKKSASELISVSVIFEKKYCDQIFKLKEYQNFLNSADTSFDVIFIPIFYLYHCYLPIAQKLAVPVIGVVPYKSWYIADRAISNLNHPANAPYLYNTSWRPSKFFERFINTFYHIFAECTWYFYNIFTLKKFYLDHKDQLKPYSKFLDIEPALIFYNTHHSMLPRPMNPNIIEIAGLQVPPVKPLPKNIKKFVEEASNGVILFSFGSVVKTSTLPSNTTAILMKVFAKIPQRVIWKYEENLPDVPNNVMLMKWLPQRDILEHPNVKAFISHCGQSGVYEAIHTATPVIACPLMVDQPGNAAVLQNLGVAVSLDIDSLSERSILEAVNTIINDTRYYDNMQKLSNAFKDNPMTPQQSVIYWTEYVIRHNGTYHLKPPSSQLNWFQYFLLDILCIVIVANICIIYCGFGCFKGITRFCKSCAAIHKNKFD